MADKITKNGITTTNNNLKQGVSKGLKDTDAISAKKDKSKVRLSKRFSYIGSHGFNVFSLIFVILLFVSLIRLLYGGVGDVVSFRDLLDVLSSAPQVSTNVKNFTQQLQILEPWVILDGVRHFINSLSNVFSILIWLFSSIIDVAIFIVYFVSWIFI